MILCVCVIKKQQKQWKEELAFKCRSNCFQRFLVCVFLMQNFSVYLARYFGKIILHIQLVVYFSKLQQACLSKTGRSVKSKIERVDGPLWKKVPLMLTRRTPVLVIFSKKKEAKLIMGKPKLLGFLLLTFVRLG